MGKKRFVPPTTERVVCVIYHCWFNTETLEIESNLVHVASLLQHAEAWIKADFGGKHHAEDDPASYFTLYLMIMDRVTVFESATPTYYRLHGQKLRRLKKPPKAPWGESEADWK